MKSAEPTLIVDLAVILVPACAVWVELIPMVAQQPSTWAALPCATAVL